MMPPESVKTVARMLRATTAPPALARIPTIIESFGVILYSPDSTLDVTVNRRR
jgi:hypothetical protein